MVWSKAFLKFVCIAHSKILNNEPLGLIYIYYTVYMHKHIYVYIHILYSIYAHNILRNIVQREVNTDNCIINLFSLLNLHDSIVNPVTIVYTEYVY